MSKHSSRSSESVEMSSVDVAQDMRRCVMVAAGSPAWTDNVKARLARAARVLGITPRRAKSLYYLEVRVITAQEYLALSARVERIERLRDQAGKNHDAIRQMAAGLDRVARGPADGDGGSDAREGGSDPAEVSAGDAVARTPF